MVRIETGFHQDAPPFGEAYLNGAPGHRKRPRCRLHHLHFEKPLGCALVRIPEDGDQRSELMSITIPK
jgi:hypothetical protein